MKYSNYITEIFVLGLYYWFEGYTDEAALYMYIGTQILNMDPPVIGEA